MAIEETGTAMEEDWEYLFDLCGYVVIRGVMTPEEVAEANAAVDRHQYELKDNTQHAKGTAFAQHRAKQAAQAALDVPDAPRRKDLRHMLGWEPADRAPFVKMLAHASLAPYLNVICGPGFRMDHAPTLITQEKGSPSGNLHGSSGPGFDPNQYYLWKDGQMHNGLVVVAWQLVDCNPGDGGLAVVPGSHKGVRHMMQLIWLALSSAVVLGFLTFLGFHPWYWWNLLARLYAGNVGAPQSMRQFKAHQEFVKQPATKAGDVIIFTEVRAISFTFFFFFFFCAALCW